MVECSVCLDMMAVDSEVRELPCSHGQTATVAALARRQNVEINSWDTEKIREGKAAIARTDVLAGASA